MAAVNENTKAIRSLAAYVCDRLAGKVLIHRYDAYSTNSVYLKFDYGVANSLRIADHAGKEHLAYRFNIILNLTEPKNDLSGRFPRNYYPPDMVDQVVEDILAGVKANAPGIGTMKRPWRTRRPESPTNAASGNKPAL